MFASHAPSGYDCPFCRLVAGRATELTDQRDVVHRDDGATAFMSPHWWPGNPGHVLVVPDGHHENLYELPAAAGHAMQDLVRTIALALKRAYGCHGVSVRQNNEPAGGQDVWHVHTHVVPRYTGDAFHRRIGEFALSPTPQRHRRAELLRRVLS